MSNLSAKSANPEQKFLKSLDFCCLLNEYIARPSSLPCQAIALFCDVGRDPKKLLRLSQKYPREIAKARIIVENYARSIDNWQIENCPLGAKDHCNILNFLLNLESREFEFFRGQNLTPETICELLKDWQGVDLTFFLQDRQRVALTDSN